jgi:hypothetical protein
MQRGMPRTGGDRDRFERTRVHHVSEDDVDGRRSRSHYERYALNSYGAPTQDCCTAAQSFPCVSSKQHVLQHYFRRISDVQTFRVARLGKRRYMSHF